MGTQKQATTRKKTAKTPGAQVLDKLSYFDFKLGLPEFKAGAMQIFVGTYGL